ncbi:MAG: GNAT family N-acetyltransferase [Pseudobdellovibrio sp.]
MKREAFKTKRLILRPLKVTDYAEWFDCYVNSLQVQSKWDIKPRNAKDCTKTIFKKVIAEHQKLALADDYYRYYVFEKKTGAILGQIDFDIFVRSTHQFANFGYQIYNRHW